MSVLMYHESSSSQQTAVQHEPWYHDVDDPSNFQKREAHGSLGWWTYPYFQCKSKKWLLSYTVAVSQPDSAPSAARNEIRSVNERECKRPKHSEALKAGESGRNGFTLMLGFICLDSVLLQDSKAVERRGLLPESDSTRPSQSWSI